MLDKTEAAALLTYFETLRGGEIAFAFVPPDQTINVKACLSGPIETEMLHPNVIQLSANVREVI